MAAHTLTVAGYVEVEHRLRGVDAAMALCPATCRISDGLDLTDALVTQSSEIFDGIGDHTWDAVLAVEPLGRPRLVGPRVDTALEALADFADLKSPWFTGHSRRVAELAAASAARLALPEPEVVRLRRAALARWLGRAGVPNTIWDKRGALTVGERERMSSTCTTPIESYAAGACDLADLASASQERIDGSGYPRSLRGTAVTQSAGVLAAADVYDALTSARPHREALSGKQAAIELVHQSRVGLLDPAAVDCVLASVGVRQPKRRNTSTGLTPREVEVLKLIATGQTTAQVAHTLGITPKTTGHHIQHIYAKIGASNRSVATLFAMQHGLV